jgi:tetratricopeptide (TPR) repeat protein
MQRNCREISSRSNRTGSESYDELARSGGRTSRRSAELAAARRQGLWAIAIGRAMKISKTFLRMKNAIYDVIGVATAAASLIVAAPLAAEQEQDWTWCVNAQHIFVPDLAIAGCTAVIQLGGETSQKLAVAFAYRGNAYREKGDLDRTLADFNEAIRIDPRFALAIVNRGMSIAPRATSIARSQTTTRQFGLTPILLRLSPIVAACIMLWVSSIVRLLILTKPSDSDPTIPSRYSIVAVHILRRATSTAHSPTTMRQFGYIRRFMWHSTNEEVYFAAWLSSIAIVDFTDAIRLDPWFAWPQ